MGRETISGYLTEENYGLILILYHPVVTPCDQAFHFPWGLGWGPRVFPATWYDLPSQL